MAKTRFDEVDLQTKSTSTQIKIIRKKMAEDIMALVNEDTVKLDWTVEQLLAQLIN